MHLNLAEKNPSRLLTSIQTAISQPRKTLSLELLGPGAMLPDTALMAYHALKARPDTLSIHAHSHTCLIDGAILPWLIADSRSIRPDTWIQVSDREEILGESELGHGDYSTAVMAVCESAANTDLRTIFHLLDEYLPVSEISGLRLFEPDLRDLGLIRSQGELDPLIELFATKPAAIKKTKRKTPPQLR